jgi:iron complex outermembrane receptor protein
MNRKWQDLSMLGAIIVAVGMPVQIASAQSGAETEDELIEEVVSVGTRSKPRSAADSPVPIDSFNAAQLDQQPHGDMTENIKNLVPSFTATPLTGDGSAFVRSTSLRGLPPDEVLLLVNNKRRHRSALIQNFGAAMSQGSHASDMGHIPSIALKNVEVLRDGAAAQYGSDAIAGVINFVLDDASEGGRIEAQYGQFYEGEQSMSVMTALIRTTNQTVPKPGVALKTTASGRRGILGWNLATVPKRTCSVTTLTLTTIIAFSIARLLRRIRLIRASWIPV